VLGVPGLTDGAREQHWIATLIEQASALPRTDSKLRRLERLLRSTGERAVVFTEYRDTLDELARHLAPVAPLATLHGGLGRAERAAAIHRFNEGDARLLLATDAAGEGLNLQARCRLVINLELPWSPRRLEQRAGRVDRLGQSRRVHVVNFVAGGTNEERVLAGLLRRTGEMRRAVGPVGDALGVRDEAIAEAMATGAWPPDSSHAPPGEVMLRATGVTRARGAAEADRLGVLRAIGAPVAAHGVADPHAGFRPSTAPGTTSTWLVLATVSWSDGTARDVERSIAGVHVQLEPTPRRWRDWHVVFAQLRARMEIVLEAHLRGRRDAIGRWLQQRAAARVARERQIAAGVDVDAGLGGGLTQRGLFDRRADRQALAHHEHVEALRASIHRSVSRHQAGATAGRPRIDVTLVVPVSDAARD